MSYNHAHDCPANPCVVPGKLGATAFVGATLNDTVALHVLAKCLPVGHRPRVGALGIEEARGLNWDDAMREGVALAFAIADEFCAQRYARAKLAQVDRAPGAAT